MTLLLAVSILAAQLPVACSGGGWDLHGYTRNAEASKPGGDDDESDGDALSTLLGSLGSYAAENGGENAATLRRLLDRGEYWSALRWLGGVVGVRGAGLGPISLQDLGALRALSELALLELTMSAHGRVLRAGNRSINAAGRKAWLHDLAADMRDLAASLPGDRLAVAAGYIALYWLMTSSLKPDSDGLVRMESYSSLTQAWWLGRQATPASTTRICEVGFNAGHSALTMLLSAPPGASMVSFDLLSKSYTPVCADFVRSVFPDRFSLIAGPSRETIPRYARANLTMPRCDLVYIDGGHTEEEAGDDLLAMSLLAVQGRTLVVMDDVGCEPEYCIGPSLAWRAFQGAGRLRELGCQAEGQRRWCWGIYL